MKSDHLMASIPGPIHSEASLCLQNPPQNLTESMRLRSLCSRMPKYRKEPVRSISVPEFSKIQRVGSVRKNKFPGSTRFGLRFSDASWLHPIRFGSVPRLVPAGSGRFGSVRPVRFCFLLLPVSTKMAACVIAAPFGHGPTEADPDGAEADGEIGSVHVLGTTRGTPTPTTLRFM